MQAERYTYVCQPQKVGGQNLNEINLLHRRSINGELIST